MDIETGKIFRLDGGYTEEFKDLLETGRLISIEESLMTSKQRKTMQVSPHDHRSPLGKLRDTHKRKLGGKKPCPCKSGKKFNKCCGK